MSEGPTEARVQQVLTPHPSAPAHNGIERVEVDLRVLPPGWLECTYRIRADRGAVVIPAADASLNPERLWEHTCCELFVADAEGWAYEEWNFSPTGQHAHFEFEDYRVRRAQPQRLPAKLVVEVTVEDDGSMVLLARVPVRSAEPQPALAVGVSVVLESADGLSYWAIRHPVAEPDFHHRDGFALALNLDPTPVFGAS